MKNSTETPTLPATGSFAERSMLQRQLALMQLITDLQTECLLENDTRTAFTPLLEKLIQLMECQFGFIAEVLFDADQNPYLKTHSITDISWDEVSSKTYQQYVATGLEFRNLKTLFGLGLTSGEAVISNNPQVDPRRGGLPQGHPPLDSFLGIPITFPDRLIAYIGLANRPDGFSESDVTFLRPLSVTIGQIFYSRRVLQAKFLAENAKKESDQYYRNLANSTSALIWTLNQERYLTFCNASRLKFLGPVMQTESQRGLFAGVHPDDEPNFHRAIIEHFPKRESFSIEYRLRNTTGEYRWILEECTPQYGLQGEFTGYIGYGLDITNRKVVENALERSERKYAELVNKIDGIVWEAHPHTYQIYFVSQQAERLLRYPLEQWYNDPNFFANLIHPDDLSTTISYCTEQTRLGNDHVCNYRVIAANGQVHWLRDFVKVDLDQEGNPIKLRGLLVDITPQKEIENSLRKTEARLYETQELARLGYWEVEVATNSIRWSPTLAKIYQIDIHNPPSLEEFYRDYIYPDDFGELIKARERLTLNPYDICHNEFRVLLRDGSIIWVHNKMFTQMDEKGQVTHVVGTTQEITERKIVEQALRESKELLEIAGEVAQVGGWDMDLQTQQLRWSAQTCRIHEVPLDYQPNIENAIHFYTPEAQPIIRGAVEKAIADGTPWKLELPFITATGKRIWVFTSGIAEFEHNKITRIYGAFQDITARKVAEQEQESLRNQLIHAQRLESVGRLAGGIAHDFNNMLSVILGNTELALEQVTPDQEIYTELTEIKKSAQRSAELTRQLLAFARKQPTLPRIVNLNEIIGGMLNLLGRLIGENITLDWKPGANLPNIKIDPVQIDQLLANLCVNAKDAIHGHGKITIATHYPYEGNTPCQAEQHPNKTFIELTVADTGSGMSPEIVEHVFEPFFTTKGVGQGTGLGLAMVHGIVNQNGGCISVASELGKGTTFTIFLPVSSESPSTSDHEKTTRPQPMTARKTILLVEDEASVLKLTKTVLEKAGYRLLVASTPHEAIHLAKVSATPIDLLLTDIVMPEMNGQELIEEIHAIQPHVRNIFMSGYPDEIHSENNIQNLDVRLIEKPFSSHNLLALIESTLK